MDRQEELAVPREIILKRLRRIEGQIRGLQRMVADERECESLVTQLAAIRSATESVGQLILNNYMKLCFRGDSQSEKAAVDSMARVMAIWNRVRVGDRK